MLQSVKSSSNFKNEIQKFSTDIAKISDEKARAEANNLLQKLILEVKKMDDMYLEMIYTKQIASMGQDFRSTIADLRKKIDQKINEQLRAQKE